MDDKLDKRIEDVEDQRRQQRAKIRIKNQGQNTLDRQGTTITKDSLRPSPQKKDSVRDLAGSPSPQRKKKKDQTDEIVVFEEARRKQKFYYEAKRLVEHPADSYKERDAVAVKFF